MGRCGAGALTLLALTLLAGRACGLPAKLRKELVAVTQGDLVTRTPTRRVSSGAWPRARRAEWEERAKETGRRVRSPRVSVRVQEPRGRE